MSLPAYWLLIFEGIAALAAVGILIFRNVLHAALSLIVLLLCFAAIYILLYAEFVGVSQILIYAGGILILILFAIMLTVRLTGKPLQVNTHNLPGGILIAAGSLAILWYALGGISLSPTGPAAQDNTQAVGYGLMTDFVAPFELAGVLLLISLVGAIISASQPKED